MTLKFQKYILIISVFSKLKILRYLKSLFHKLFIETGQSLLSISFEHGAKDAAQNTKQLTHSET